MARLIVDHTGRSVLVRLLSVCWRTHPPTMTEQPKGSILKCLGVLVTCRLWFAWGSTLNQRVQSSSLRRPTKFFPRTAGKI